MGKARRMVVAAAVLLAAAACGEAAPTATDATDTPTDTAATTEPIATPTTAPATTAPTPTTNGQDSTPPATPGDGTVSGDAADLPPADENDKESAGFPDPTGETALLTDVEIGDHTGYERVVFTFTEGSPVPSWRVVYTDAIVQSGSGNPVDVAGDAFLAVTMSGATGVQFKGEDIVEVYTGPDRIAGESAGATAIQEVVAAGDFEAVLDWGIGLDERRPFRAFTLSDPSRLVVDVITES